MSWIDDASALLAEPDEQTADAPASDWRSRAQALLDSTPDQPPTSAKPAKANTSWLDRAKSVLSANDATPTPEELKVIQQAPPYRGAPQMTPNPEAPKAFNEYADARADQPFVDTTPKMTAETPMMRLASRAREAKNTVGSWLSKVTTAPDWITQPVKRLGDALVGEATAMPEREPLNVSPDLPFSAQMGEQSPRVSPAEAAGLVAGGAQGVAGQLTPANLALGASGKVLTLATSRMASLAEDVQILKTMARAAKTAEEADVIGQNLASTVDRLAKLEALRSSIAIGHGLVGTGFTLEGAAHLIEAQTWGERAQAVAEMAGGGAMIGGGVHAAKRPFGVTRSIVEGMRGAPTNVTPPRPSPAGGLGGEVAPMPPTVPSPPIIDVPPAAPRGPVPVTPKAPGPVMPGDGAAAVEPQTPQGPTSSPEALIEDIKDTLEELSLTPSPGHDARTPAPELPPTQAQLEAEGQLRLPEPGAEPPKPPAPVTPTPAPPKPEDITAVGDDEIVRRIKEKRAARQAANFALTPSPGHDATEPEEPDTRPTHAELEAEGQIRFGFKMPGHPPEPPPAPPTPKPALPVKAKKEGQERLGLPDEHGILRVDPKHLEYGTWNHETNRTEGEGVITRAYSADKVPEGKIRGVVEVGGKLFTNLGGGGTAGNIRIELYPVVPRDEWKGPVVTYRDKKPGQFSYEGIGVKFRGKEYVLGPNSGRITAISNVEPEKPQPVEKPRLQFGQPQPAPVARPEIGDLADLTDEGIEDDVADYEGADRSTLPPHEQQALGDMERELKLRKASSVAEGLRSLTDAEVQREIERYTEHAEALVKTDDELPEGYDDYMAALDAEEARRSGQRQGQRAIDFTGEKAPVPVGPKGVTWFRSGVKRAPTDFDGLADAKVPIGITAHKLAPAIESRAIDYLKNGGTVFVDSGAYGTPDIDHAAILNKYVDIGEAIGPENRQRLHVVAPDLVGNQEITLKLQAEHAEAIKKVIASGVNVIVPVQKGDLSLSAVLAMQVDEFGPKASFGLPFNKAPYSIEDITTALRNVPEVQKIHLLGIGENRAKLAQAVAAIHEVRPGIEITTDSNPITAMVGKGRPGQKAIEEGTDEGTRDRIDDVPASDTTELWGALGRGDLSEKAFTYQELARIAHAANLEDVHALREHKQAGTLDELLTTHQDAVDQALFDIAYRRGKRVAGPATRRGVIAETQGKPKVPVTRKTPQDIREAATEDLRAEFTKLRKQGKRRGPVGNARAEAVLHELDFRNRQAVRRTERGYGNALSQKHAGEPLVAGVSVHSGNDVITKTLANIETELAKPDLSDADRAELTRNKAEYVYELDRRDKSVRKSKGEDVVVPPIKRGAVIDEAAHPADESMGTKMALRVFKALRKHPKALDQLTLEGDSAAVRRRLAALIGETPQLLGEHSRFYEDAIEAALANRLADDYANNKILQTDPLAKQIAHAREVEALLPRAHRGIEKKELQQFSTPLPLSVAAVHALGPITPQDRILEPTAGTGNLIAAIDERRQITALELDPHRAALLAEQGYGSPTPTDYLTHKFPPANGSHAPNLIITNPPWGKYSTGKYRAPAAGLGFAPNDVAERFIAKNLRDLQDGGRLVAIMPTTMLDVGSAPFRKWLNDNFTVRAIITAPPGSYRTRGTDVESVLLVVDKTKAGARTLPKAQTPQDWSQYADAVEAIHARTQEAARTLARPEGDGPPDERDTGTPKPGRDTDVRGERPPDVVAGKRGTTARPPGTRPPDKPTGDRRPAPGDSGGAAKREPDAGRPLTENEQKRKEALDKLRQIARDRSKASVKGDPSEGSGELGFAQAVGEPDDEALLLMVQALRSYLNDGITEFRKAILAFEKDFGDGWVSFKDELELAWDTLQGSAPGMDEARAVDDVLNEDVRDRIRRSDFWRPYDRRTDIEGTEHPKVIIEAKQLAGVPYPKLTMAAPKAFTRAAKEGWASVEQVEQALAALQANIEPPGGKSHGYLIADAVGVGKSRENALVVNGFQDEAIKNKREQRLLVVTKNKQNVADLLENFPYVATGRTADGVDLNTGQKGKEKGSVPYEIVDLRDWKDSARLPTHKDYKPLPKYKNAIYVTDSYNLRRYYLSLAQLGLHGIVGDEAHSFKNVWGSMGGKAWQGLHAQIFKNVPRAQQRFLYSTATPTQDVAGYEYLYGLRLWPIDGFGDWLSLITGALDEKSAKEVQDNADKGVKDPDKFVPPDINAPTVGEQIQQGIRASGRSSELRALTPAEMEQIPREFKMLGRMSARDLWREGTEFEVHRGKLSDKHRDLRNGFALLARDILDAVSAFGKMNKIGGIDSLMRASGMLQFAAKRIALEPSMEEAITVARDYIAKGYQPVIRVINVGRVGDVQDVSEDGGEEEPVDTPLGGHLAAAINAINTREIDTDDSGNVQDHGDIPEAIRVKGELMERARDFVLQSPVDMLETAFGKDRVAVKIGGSNKAMQLAQKEFQQGKRDVMLISAAGSTGINLDHRVLTAPPKGHVGPWASGRRVFINAQFDWSATEELQAIGRVDRASSITPPLVKPITFGNAAENRFLAVVANRMASLGATSRGGAAATGSAKGLEEFEIGGSDTMAAIRDVWRELPDAVKDHFWGSRYRDPNTRGMTSVATLPDSVGVEDIQRALLYVPIAEANDFWKQVLNRRDVIREHMGDVGEDARTKAFSGEVLQEAKLTDTLTIYKLKNDAGHKFGLLVGVIMPEMPRIAPMLPLNNNGTPRRSYISFQTDTGRTLTGLEIMWTRVGRIATEFGKDFGQEVLDTADKVREALRGGDRVPLVQRNSKNGKRWVLRQTTGHIRIDNAGWADQELLKNNGAWFRDVGSFWYVKPDQFDTFIDRFPAEHPAQLQAERAAEAGDEGEVAGYGSVKATLPPPPGTKPKAPVNAKQQRPSEVIKALTKALGIPARVGGYRSRSGNLIIHGIYKIRPEIIRTKLANDLPIFSHEVGHHLDKVYNLAVPRWRSELLPLGAPTSGDSFTQKKRLMEGVAEFVRLWMTDPLTAATRAPNFYGHFEKTIEGSIREALKEAQQQIRGIVASDYVTRLKQKIDMAGANVNADPRTFIQKVYERVFDDLGRIQEAVTEMGTPEHVLQDAHKLAVMARGSASIAQGFIEHGIKGRDGKFKTGGLDDILKPVAKRLDDFVAYLVALRARELNARGKDTGFTKEEVNATIAEFEPVAGFTDTRDKLYAFQDAILDYLGEHGILSDDSRRAMRQMGQFYVPFQRVMDGYTRELAAGRSGRQIANRRSPLRFFRGSTRDVINPLESIIRNVYAAVDVATNNDAMVALVRQARKSEGSGKWLDRIPTQMAATVFNLDRLEKDIRAELAKNGVNLPDNLDFNKVVRVWMPQSFADGNRGYITVLENGTRYFYSVNDKPLFEALTAVGPKVVHPAIQLFLVPPASLLRATATALNVTFGTRNPVRDTFVAWVQSDYGFRLGYDTLRGLFLSVLDARRGEERYKQFMTSGVMQASVVGNDRRRLQTDIQKLTGTKARELWTRMRDTAMRPVEMLQAYAELGEKATRYGAFLRALEQEKKKGIPETEAVARATMKARGSTVDFSVGGSWVRFLNTFTAFLNARTQGWKRAAESAKANPAGFALKATMGISMLSALLWWLNKDDDRYEELPAWEKNTFWHVRAPYTDSGFVRFPKPFELGTIFGTSVEMALDAMWKDDPDAVSERMTQAFGGNGRVGGPVGLATDLLMQLLPTAVLPVAEVASNYDRFRDRYIVQPWDESIENDLKYTRWTSDTAKVLAGYLHMAPVQVEHLIYGYTGGFGRGVLQALDTAGYELGMTKGRPSLAASRFPLLSAFYREGLDESAASIAEMYRLQQKAAGVGRSINTYASRGEEAKGDELEKANAKLLDRASALNQGVAAMKTYRAEMDRIFADTTMLPAAKRDALNEVYRDMVDTARDALGKAPLATTRPNVLDALRRRRD